MSVLRALFGRNAAIGILIFLCVGAGSARAEQDQFMVGLGRVGEIVSGDGSGFNHGMWYYYPHTDGLVQWFYNGVPSGNHKTIVSADLTILSRDPAAGTVANVEVSLVWTAQGWPQDQDSPPLPDARNPGQEQRDIQERAIVQRTDVRQSLFTSTSFEIPDFCPQWVGVEIRGQSVSVQGVLRHDCASREGPPPSGGRDFGDAPEGTLAYPSSGLFGLFPTCIGVGPAAWIEHAGGTLYFGPRVDMERDGNAGLCPTFVPGAYNRDEGVNDGDAGLLKVRAYTIRGSVGAETVEPLIWSGLESLGDTCAQAVWGANIDIEVHNTAADGRLAYVNVLMDWNHDGIWQGSALCVEGTVPEHVLVNFPVKAGYNGLLSILNPPSFRIGPVPGYVWARFTISERPVATGWDGNGIFKDGETEDYLLHVKGSEPAGGRNDGDRLTWSQPPVEQDLISRTPIYCGWDEPAYVSKPLSSSAGTWNLVADNFRSIGDMPVTSVHWWGSYQGWQGTEAPRIRPDAWRIGFWSNVPASNPGSFARPGKLLWVVSVPGDRVEEAKAGIDDFPRRPADTAFEYLLRLQPHEHFRQSDFAEADARERIFWISITAVYTGSSGPEHPWGWKTRPGLWSDGAVRAEFKRDDLRAGFALSSSLPQPVADSLLCARLDKYDMAFELGTDPEYVKWEQPFTGIRHWAHYEDEKSLATEGPTVAAKWTQLPDTTTAGVDVDITQDLPPTWPPAICADDFQCRESGPITGITLWASWYHDVLPSSNAANVTFTLSIRQDIPAERSPTGHSMPGRVLWRKQFTRGQFSVEPVQGRAESYYSPANQAFEQNNHLMIYKYTFKIDPSEAFRQIGSAGSPVVYWLTAQAHIVHAPGSVATRLGWKTSTSHWNDAAVWVKAEEPYDGSWNSLQYPKGHSLASRQIDLAFAIETGQPGAGTVVQRIVADDWQCRGRQPVTGIVWWGSYLGYGYRPCECQQMPEPRRPDYFLLSIWTDAPDPDPGNPRDFSHPGRKIWEYEAEAFDEVFVGFDKHPEPTSSIVQGFEPVYRYSVRLPEDEWFRQEGAESVYWLSVVAVYREQRSIIYPWGWTNHPCESWGLRGRAMLAHWRLDEAAGRIAADSSGNGNDGTVFGNPLWRPDGGWLCGALDLDGRGDYVKVERPKGFDCAPNSFSVSAWIHPRETRGQWRTILEYDREGINRNRFGLWLDPEGRFHFRVGQNTWHSQQSLAPNQWHHVTGVFDAAARSMKLYVNALLAGTANSPTGFITPCLSTLIIGACGTADAEYFNGLIDDVRVFGAALTAEEVLMLVGAGRNEGAVAAQVDSAGVAATLPWTQLLDQTGMLEDMSFVLFTQPLEVAEHADGEDGEGYVVVIPVGSAEKK